jgi:hypothetical protein
VKSNGCDNVDWIFMVQDRNQWGALLITVMSLLGPIKDGEKTDRLRYFLKGPAARLDFSTCPQSCIVYIL